MKSDDLFLISLAITTITVDSASSEPTGFLSVTRRNPRDFYPLHVGTHGISIRYMHVGTHGISVRYTSEPTGFLSVTRHERSVMDRNPVGSDDVDSVDIYS